MSILLTKNLSLKKIQLFVAVILGFVFLITAFAQTASAHQDPGGCSETGIGISLAVFRADETTSIGSGTVSPGETIKYRVTLSALGSPSCNYEAGALSITTPDGTTDVTPGGGIPLVSVGNPFVSDFVSYVVDTSDMGGDGDIDAEADYTGGQSHTGEVHDTATGSVTKQNAVTGNIITIKQTTPEGSQQLFDFNASWDAGDAPDFQLADNGQNDSGPLAAGSYDVSEVNIPSGWTLNTTNCVSSLEDPADTDGQALDLDAGETITCTFTNSQAGNIIVDKITDPSGDPTEFDFNPSWSESNFTLTDEGTPVNSGNLTPDNYSVAELAEAGWDSDDGVCDSSDEADTSTPGSIDLDAGETITCTFTNTQQTGNIIVDKVTNPADDPTEFDFDPSWSVSNFSLTDNDTPEDSGPLLVGQYSVSELAETGWDSDDGVCDSTDEADSSTPGDIDLDAGETITCTFTNTREMGHIIVDKVTDPSGDTTSFSFDVTGEGYDDFSLTDTASPNDQELVTGTYSVSETLPANWELTSATCVSSLGESETETIGNLELDAGETITCTFTNTLDVVEWCSPGYWRNHEDSALEAASAGSFALTDTYALHFDSAPTLKNKALKDGAVANPTLWQVLQNPQWYGDGAFNMVGDLLSMAHPDVDFEEGDTRVENCPLN